MFLFQKVNYVLKDCKYSSTYTYLKQYTVGVMKGFAQCTLFICKLSIPLFTSVELTLFRKPAVFIAMFPEIVEVEPWVHPDHCQVKVRSETIGKQKSHAKV